MAPCFFFIKNLLFTCRLSTARSSFSAWLFMLVCKKEKLELLCLPIIIVMMCHLDSLYLETGYGLLKLLNTS